MVQLLSLQQDLPDSLFTGVGNCQSGSVASLANRQGWLLPLARAVVLEPCQVVRGTAGRTSSARLVT